MYAGMWKQWLSTIAVYYRQNNKNASSKQFVVDVKEETFVVLLVLVVVLRCRHLQKSCRNRGVTASLNVRVIQHSMQIARYLLTHFLHTKKVFLCFLL